MKRAILIIGLLSLLKPETGAQDCNNKFTIEFKKRSEKISKNQMKTLNLIAELTKANDSCYIRINALCFTEVSAMNARNWNRTEKTINYLVKKGVNNEIIYYYGYADVDSECNKLFIELINEKPDFGTEPHPNLRKSKNQ